MKSVGVKKLKARLSEYLRMAKGGETILVTERDEVVAELRPARAHSRAVSSQEEALESLADAGEISRAALPRQGWTWKATGIGLPAGSAQALLDELRADRDE